MVVDDPSQLLPHDGPLPAPAGQDFLEVADVGSQALGFSVEPLALEGREPTERHVEYVGRLDFGQSVSSHQPRSRLRRVLGAADQSHHIVDVVESRDQSLHDVETLVGPPQPVAGAAHHDLEAVRHVVLAQLPETDRGGDAVDEHHVVDVQALLEGGVPVELRQDGRRVGSRLQVDLEAQSVHVAQVGDAGDAEQPPSADQVGDPRHDPLGSYQIGQLRDDHGPASPGDGLDADPRPHPHRSPAAVVRSPQAFVRHHDATPGEVGSGQHVHELVGRRPRPAPAARRAA